MVGVQYGVLETKWSKYIEDLVMNFVKWHKVLELITGFSNTKDIQFSSVTQSCLTLWDSMDCLMPGFPVHHQLPNLFRLMSVELVMPSNHVILCCPLLLLPSIFPSIRVFSNESVLRITWPKYWSFSFSVSPSNEYSGLISFRMDWLDLLAVQKDIGDLEKTV